MKILICGGFSQDSQVLLNILKDVNYDIDLIARRSSGNIPKSISKLVIEKKINLIYQDLINTYELAKIVEDGSYTHIFNFASNSFVQNSNSDIHNCIKENNAITYNILNAIKNASSSPWLMHPLSSEIFGNPTEIPQNENTVINPINAYGISKVSDMFLCDLYEKNFDLKIFRPILYNHESIYRGRQFFSKKVFNFAIKLQQSNFDIKNPLEFYNATSKRDWGYAEEYCSIFFEAAKKNITGKYILGTGKSISVEDFIDTVFNCFEIKFKKVINSNGLLEFYDKNNKIIAVELSRDPIDEGRRLVADNRLIKETFNIKEFSMGIEAIKKLHNDYLKNV